MGIKLLPIGQIEDGIRLWKCGGCGAHGIGDTLPDDHWPCIQGVDPRIPTEAALDEALRVTREDGMAPVVVVENLVAEIRRLRALSKGDKGA